MIYFPMLRTRRLVVQLQELSIGASLELAAMPAHMGELSCTAFLRRAVQTATGVEDPASWTVQERTLVVAHYLAATAEDGPDFKLDSGSKYSDYLDGGKDIPTPADAISIGELGGDVWRLQHLTGAMAEAIERVLGEVPGVGGRLHWLLGAMSAQMLRANEATPDVTAGDYDESLLARMKIFMAYPSSSFAALMSKYLGGRERLHHLFRFDFNDDGIVILPKGGDAVNLPPARFPVDACIPSIAFELVGKHDGPGI